MRKGLSLIELAISIVVLSIVLSVGLLGFTRVIRWSKKSLTVESVEKARDEIIASVYANNNTFLKVSKLGKDAFSQNLYLVVSHSLLGKDVCNVKESALAFYDNATGMAVRNVAFVVFSKGSDYVSNTYCNGTLVVSTEECSGQVETDSSKDVVSFITLPELKKKLGCKFVPLKILNFELPHANLNKAYNATIFAAGGIKPYEWCFDGKLPLGLKVYPINSTCPHFSVSDNLTISGVPREVETTKVKVCVRDKNLYKSCKNFVLSVYPISKTNFGSYSVYYRYLDFSMQTPWYIPAVKIITNSGSVFLGTYDSFKRYYERKPNQTFSGEDVLFVVTSEWGFDDYSLIPVKGKIKTLDKNGDGVVEIICIVPPDAIDENSLWVRDEKIQCSTQ